MRLFFVIVISSLLSVLLPNSYAQDSTISRYVTLSETIDTTINSTIDLNNFQSYRYKHSPFIATSGNIGLPTHLLNDISLPGYNGFFQGFSSSLFTLDDLKFYNQQKDITTLRYINGANSEQYFNVFHSNQFGEGLNLSFDYNRIISEGFYVNQLTDNTHFNTTLNYKSKSGNYELKLGYLISNIKTQENGGVTFSDSSDENVTNSNLIPFNLSSASNHLRSQAIVLNQSLLLSDSSFLKQVKLHHQSDLSWSWKWYKDQGGQEFYERFYIDSSVTFDSIHYSKASNSLGASIFDELLRVDYLYEFHDYHQNSNFDTLYVSQFFRASLNKDFGKLSTSLSFKQGLTGFNQGDYLQKLNMRYRLDTSSIILFSFSNTRLSPFYWQNKFYGNHVFYNNEFDPQDQLKTSFSLVNTSYKFSIGFEYDQSSNMILYDSVSEPFQHDASINRLLVNIKKDFNFGKFTFNNDLNYQYIDNEELLPLPSIFTSHSLYFEDLFFEEKLSIQIGADARYIGAYTGYGFFPESAAFTLQSERELGDFLYLDLFLNFRIQHVRVFAKVENLLGDQFDPAGMMINNYAVPGRAFKIGISWAMFN